MNSIKVVLLATVAFIARIFGFAKRGLHGFFYKNNCVLCVWARYCLFFMGGIAFSAWGGREPKVITGFFISAAALCTIFIALALIPPPKKDESK